MRPVALLGVAVIVGIAMASPPVAVGAATCSASTAPGAKVVIASSEAVVYKRRERDSLQGTQWIHYGCLYRRDREWPLSGFVEFRQFFGPWALAGRYVAFAHDYEEAAPDSQNDEIHVVDLRTGKELSDAGLAAEGDPGGESRAHAIVLKGNASAAWIASYHDDDFDVVFQVWSLKPGHERRKLDQGKRIRPHSLALSANGRTVYWREGAKTRSARLR